MARTYEGTFILNASLDEAGLTQEQARIEEVIAREGGTVKQWDKWGRRRLAFEIAGHTDGFYAFLTFEAEPGAIAKLTQTYRLDENIVRFMCISQGD
jgi:small subunit ribosomal protein S6